MNLTIEELRKIDDHGGTVNVSSLISQCLSLLEQREGLKKKVEGMKAEGVKDYEKALESCIAGRLELSCELNATICTFDEVLALLDEKS